GDGAGLRLEINQQEIVGGWATGNGVIAWPESGKINRMHGDSRGQVKGVFGDCQFTCFPDCQLALSPDPAMNHKKARILGEESGPRTIRSKNKHRYALQYLLPPSGIYGKCHDGSGSMATDIGVALRRLYLFVIDLTVLRTYLPASWLTSVSVSSST